MVTGPAGASVDVLARKAFLNPACQNEVGLVAVVPGVLRLEPRRPLPDGRLSDHLAVSELIPRQINFHASRKPIPHVRFRSLAVAEDVRRQDFSAKDVVQDQRRNVALPARGIARRPSIVLFRRIETPAVSDGAFDLSERVHRTRVPTAGDIPERWPRQATSRVTRSPQRQSASHPDNNDSAKRDTVDLIRVATDRSKERLRGEKAEVRIGL